MANRTLTPDELKKAHALLAEFGKILSCSLGVIRFCGSPIAERS